MELDGVPQKDDESSPWDLFYVCSSARNWVYYMNKGIYVIPFGE